MSSVRTVGAQGDVRLYLEARNYIDVEVVRLEPRLSDPDGKVATVCEFNRDLGNPQAAFKSVQVAGTSGKGSTCTWLARILHACGAGTGMHVSPYLQVATEKTWINGRFANPKRWHDALLRVRPTAERYRARTDCRASVHGMTSLAVTYECFRQAAIDWAVIETGVGGRFDLIQGLDRRLAVITDIGLDHVKTLGEDLRTIAWHKAGIMEGAPRALATFDPEVWPVFEEQAQRCGCRLEAVHPDQVATLHSGSGRLLVRLSLRNLGVIEIPWPFENAGFRLRNFAMAAAAADALAEEGIRLTPEALVAALAQGAVPGRMETVQAEPTVILDAAHNLQKMQALVESVFPESNRKGGRRPGGGTSPPRRLLLVMAATGDRAVEEFAAVFPVRPDVLVLTRPLLYGKKVSMPAELAQPLRGWARETLEEDSPRRAVEAVLSHARPDDLVLVTGSIYLVGQARDYWYPWEQVLLQGTSFPIRETSSC
ncbi:MAG: hypothetical protein FJ109_15325 [Deltaproteobacteria bacterium]|nr:hypothetical protein [Deltaproteobacteria bacterium]